MFWYFLCVSSCVFWREKVRWRAAVCFSSCYKCITLLYGVCVCVMDCDCNLPYQGLDNTVLTSYLCELTFQFFIYNSSFCYPLHISVSLFSLSGITILQSYIVIVILLTLVPSSRAEKTTISLISYTVSWKALSSAAFPSSPSLVLFTKKKMETRREDNLEGVFFRETRSTPLYKLERRQHTCNTLLNTVFLPSKLLFTVFKMGSLSKNFLTLPAIFSLPLVKLLLLLYLRNINGRNYSLFMKEYKGWLVPRVLR